MYSVVSIRVHIPQSADVVLWFKECVIVYYCVIQRLCNAILYKWAVPAISISTGVHIHNGTDTL